MSGINVSGLAIEIKKTFAGIAEFANFGMSLT